MRISDWSSDVCSSDLQPPHGQIGEQRGLQRALDDEIGIAFFRHRVAAIVMDTMAVHRQRGIAEKQHRIGIDAGHPRYLRVRCIARRIVGSAGRRSEEHTSELQSLMRISYAVFCLKKKTD